MSNNLIFRNGDTGVTINKAANVSFQFNTVAGNGGATQFGGLDCGNGAAKLIERSIVATNATQGTPQTAGDVGRNQD